MKKESEMYDRLLHLLRNSRPVLGSTEDIEREVIKSILKNNADRLTLADITEFLFGWVYLAWVRRSLIAVSVILVAVFVYQQGIILQKINYLSTQPIVAEGESSYAPSDELGKKLMMYKLTNQIFPSKKITISEKQMEDLLKSVNELQSKYKDLMNMINEDPEMKKYIENKLIENSQTKIKL